MNASSIELSLTPALYEWRTLRSNHTTVAVDILRATTSVCAAFAAGAEEVVPLDTLEGLIPYQQRGFLSAAERGGKKVDSAQCGNSPTEYLTMDLHGKHIAFSTTNGTVSILRGSDADRTFVGAFANLSVLSDHLIAHPQDLVILCSGWKNDFSVEDTLFAGALCQRLLASGTYTTHNDAVLMAVNLWRLAAADPYGYCLQNASHVRRLFAFGGNAIDDVAFAFRPDTCPVLPQLMDGTLRNIL